MLDHLKMKPMDQGVVTKSVLPLLTSVTISYRKEEVDDENFFTAEFGFISFQLSPFPTNFSPHRIPAIGSISTSLPSLAFSKV